MSFMYKGGSILASFLIVPLTIDFLNTENYGVWLTLSSFIAWFSFFDIGLGNGLRNKFAEAKAKGDINLARGYVSSAYYTIGAVSILLILVFSALNFLIDWSEFFNISSSLRHELKILMPILFGLFCTQLVVKLITTIYTADQNHSMQAKINFFIQTGSVLIIWLLGRFSEGSILIFGIAFSLFPVILLLIINWFAFHKRYKEVKPSIKFFRKEHLKDIFGLGINFFVLQMSGIIIFSTDNIIVSRIFGSSSVVSYNIAYKYFGVANMILSMVLTPYWSSITDAYLKLDFEWIKTSMKNLIKITWASIFIIGIMFLISSWFYNFWIGSKVIISTKLNLCMACYFSLVNFYLPFTYFINGTGKIRLQVLTVMIMAIVNIPLSIYFGRNLNFGPSGVILASTICLLPHAILVPLQYSKIINNCASGIWKK
jgi:O-antigen/teichoic acid export membrane protein